MQSYWSQLALVGVLVIVNAVFAGSEMALVSLRDSQIQRLERTGRAGRVLARLAKDPNRFLATIQIGITLAGFLASAAAAVSLAKPLVPLLGVLGGAAETVAIVVVTLALTFVTLVFGELAPKRIAMQSAERWALLVARPLDVLASRHPAGRLGARRHQRPGGPPGRAEPEARSATRSARTSCATSSPATTASPRSSGPSSPARWRSPTGSCGRCSYPGCRSSRSTAGPPRRPPGWCWPPPATPGRRWCATAAWTTRSA